MDVHFLQVKAGDAVACGGHPVGKRLDERGGVALCPGATVENYDLLAHSIAPIRKDLVDRTACRAIIAARLTKISSTHI